MTPARKLGAACVGAALAVSLTACGSDEGDKFADQSVKEIEKQVKADMKTAKSLHLKGSIDQEQKLSLDLNADTDGNCVGTIGQGDVEAQVLSVGGESYLKADKAFWEQQAGPQADQIVALIGDKWAKMPSSAGAFDQFCDLDNFLEDLVDDTESDDDEKLEKGKVEDINGTEALELIKKEDDGTTRAWVATEDKHYFLKIEREGDDSGSFTFSDYDKGVDAEAPSKEEVVDLSALGG